MLYAEKKLK